MNRIELSIFKGRAPRVHARNLPQEFGQTCANVDLSQGMLKPFYKPGDTKTLNTTAWRSIFPVKSGATFWMCSLQEANFVNVPVYNGAGRFIYTDGVRGMESNYALASNSGAETFGAADDAYYLGVPKPSAALTVTVMGAGDGVVGDSVSYFYTFITSWGYEGEPSDPTDNYDVEGGEYVKLENFEIPVPTGYNIVGIRIYRTSTASDDSGEFLFGSELMTGASDDYVTPAEITTAGDLWYDQDSVTSELTLASDLGEVIACENYIEPPSALDGLLALPNGCVAAFRVNEVYFSEPYIHYGYPDDYIVKTHFTIKAIGHYGTTVVVGTEGNPYTINGYDPQAVSSEKLPDPQSCLYSRGMVSGPSFVLYPSPDGLYMVSEEGNGLATKEIFTKEQWRTLLTTTTAYDKTVIGFFYDGKYYGFFEGSADGFIIDFTQNHYTTFSLPSGYLVYGGYLDIITDTLYLLVKIGSTYYIKAWEGDTTDSLVFTWKTKVFVTNYAFYSCAKVNGDLAVDSTGTGTIASTGTAVEGTGTSFTTELVAGGVIYNATLNEYREISSITDNDSLVLVSAFTSNVSAGAAFKYNSVTLNLYKDNVLFFTKALNSTEPFRLPSGKGREWEFEIKGDRKVYKLTVAQAMEDL